ncbi:MAG TPA: hypothetical protein VIV60_35035 [Polyangiaceae bacterium]
MVRPASAEPSARTAGAVEAPPSPTTRQARLPQVVPSQAAQKDVLATVSGSASATVVANSGCIITCNLFWLSGVSDQLAG